MSFPHYPNYKASGVEWLGEVPEHWNVSRLGFESWVRARLGWKGLKAEEYADDGFAFLSTPNIKGLSIDFENVNFITQERFDESPEIKVREGDVLLAKDGSTLGTVNVVRQLPRPTTVNSSIAVITPNASLNGVFLYYLFASSYMEQTIQRTKGGMGVPHLFQADLNKFYLPIPSLAEQIRIAAFLDRETAKIDGLVAEQRRLMELLKEKRQAIISHAVTQGLNPHVPMKPSGIEWLGEVPKHWEVRKLKYLCDIQTGDKDTENAVDDGLYPFFVRSQTVERINSMAFDCEAILTAGDGVGVGKVFHYHNGPFDFHQRVYMMNNFREVSGPYLFHFFRENFYKVALEGGAKSTVDSLRRPVFMNFTVCVPPKAEQAAIVATVEQEAVKFDTLTIEAQRAIDLLQERRSALISAAVTGQVDVRGLGVSSAVSPEANCV
jgi:type I restriction enzyme S subunit